MKGIAVFLPIILFFSLNSLAQGRQSLFKAGATVGLNMTQVDGDRQFGYKKKGLNFGLRGAIIINKRFEIQTELLYNFKGSEPDIAEKGKNRKQINLGLQYADVPLLLKLYIAKSPEHDYYLWDVYAGVSYGRLLKSKLEVYTNNYTLLDTMEMRFINQKGLNSSEFNIIVGVSRYFSPRFGLSIRHTSALNIFYDNPLPLVPIATGQTSTKEFRTYSYFRNFFFSINAFYDFIAPKQVKKKVKKSIKFQN